MEVMTCYKRLCHAVRTPISSESSPNTNVRASHARPSASAVQATLEELLPIQRLQEAQPVPPAEAAAASASNASSATQPHTPPQTHKSMAARIRQ